jgi:hypothetical protein
MMVPARCRGGCSLVCLGLSLSPSAPWRLPGEVPRPAPPRSAAVRRSRHRRPCCPEAPSTTYIGIYPDLDWVVVILSDYNISNEMRSLIQLQDQLITQHAAS